MFQNGSLRLKLLIEQFPAYLQQLQLGAAFSGFIAHRQHVATGLNLFRQGHNQAVIFWLGAQDKILQPLRGQRTHESNLRLGSRSMATPLRCSTVVWAFSICLVTIFESMGTSSGRARSITQLTAPVANRRMRSSSRDRAIAKKLPRTPTGSSKKKSLATSTWSVPSRSRR